MVENNNSVLYTALADRVSLPPAKSILLTIAANHHQHSEILKAAYNGPGAPRTNKNSEKEFSAVFGIAYEIYKEIIKTEELSKEDLSTATEKLSILENALADKYLDIQTRVPKNKPNGTSQKNFRNVFAGMVSDSVHHRELLATIKTLDVMKHDEKMLEAVPFSCMIPASTNPVCQSP
jgi:hypothetical protein